MTRDQLVTRCSSRYRDTTNRLVTAAEWADYINDAYTSVVAASPLWPFLETRDESLSVAAGAASVSLPTDGWRVSAVYNATDKIRMRQLDGRSDYRDWFPDPAGSLGTPEFYRLRSNVLEVYPRPAVTTEIDVDVFVPPAELTAGAQEPVFPEQYHRILVYGALALAYEDDDNLPRMQAAQARRDQLLADMLRDLLGPRTDSYPGILDNFF